MKPDEIRKLPEWVTNQFGTLEQSALVMQAEMAAQLAELNQHFAAALEVFRAMQATSEMVAKHVIARDEAVMNPAPPPKIPPAGGLTQ